MGCVGAMARCPSGVGHKDSKPRWKSIRALPYKLIKTEVPKCYSAAGASSAGAWSAALAASSAACASAAA